MGCYEGCEWVSLGGLGHVELSEGFSVAGISPLLQDKNGYLPSIG